MMHEAVSAISRFDRVNDDCKLDNYHVVGNKIMIVDMERMSEHVADKESLDFLVRADVDHIARFYEDTRYWMWKEGRIAIDTTE
jgi:hypothetical protein